MKIGAFARHNRVSIDTIRHYIDLELLIPQKIGKQYQFDLQCQKDFEEILYFKSLGFTLLEIKDIFIVKHLGKMTSFQREEFYQNIFKDKHEKVKMQIEALNREKSCLEDELHKLDGKREAKPFPMGISLNWLRLLCCHRCGGPLLLKEAAVEDNMILSGTLKCNCGVEYSIQDGILFVNPDKAVCEDRVPEPLSYIRHTDAAYLNHVYKTLEWTVQKIDFKGLSEKVVLELGSGSGFLLRRIYDDLPENTVYIAVDCNRGGLLSLKKILENAEKKKEIFFICCDFLELPLAEHSADLICDFAGSSNYGFDHSEFLLNSMERYFKKDAALFGSYIIFRNFSSDSLVPVDCRENFRVGPVGRKIEELGFLKQSDYLSDVVAKGGIYENYFQNGEKVLTYGFAGKRLG
ncbi:methyltransferase domain-containing protein [Caproicibacter fermentans]|uniref:Methyltransferase domain-containing protein n=1 Tax=Caproicibacter fermentans TaxID=2576756 RepID=A0A7G8T6M4_9FIRM|nr:methyltransferase domain-containing protein [Caproicibacter fermentans]QNK39265.1 methyltransferase domain-containing protein [Caproicibacter fermentans]